ncbi:MAG: flavodoxin family protein [Anaerolineaceae bacterium]|nr:flavodoxin family protein [Anaerolineaceae bacterium]
MKILALVGSYRKNGNTAQIVGLIRDHLDRLAASANQTIEVETVFLGHQQIGLCRGCRVCFDQGEEKCPQKDDLPLINAKMKQADGLLVASPVYVDDVSGTVKNWIDRLAYNCHRPGFAGKSAYLVVTVGSTPTGNALRTLRTALSTWGCHIVGLSGFKTGALMKPAEINARFQKQTEEIARKFYQDIQMQKYTRPSFLSLMMFKIQQWSWARRALEDTVDVRYWKELGWFEPDCDFYIPHRASRVKVLLARLTGAVIARFVA